MSKRKSYPFMLSMEVGADHPKNCIGHFQGKDEPTMPPRIPVFPITVTLQDLQESSEQGYGNTFRILSREDCSHPMEVTEAFWDANCSVIYDAFRFNEEDNRKIIKRVLTEPSQRIWATLVAEGDSCMQWGKRPHDFPSRSAAAEWCMQQVFEQTMKIKSDLLPGGNIRETIRNNKPGQEIEGNFIAQCAMVFLIHHWYRLGIRMVWLERNCWLSNTQLGLAFLRGAARQFNRPFGIDFSAWGDLQFFPRGGGMYTFYDTKGRRMGGVTESLLLREWIIAFMAGVSLLQEEMSWNANWFVTSEGSRKQSPCGMNAKRFGNFAIKWHDRRGQSYRPVGVLMQQNHGWDAGSFYPCSETFIWGNTVPRTRGDCMIDAFFNEVFLGHTQAVRSFYANWNLKVPWKNKQEYRQILLDGHDMRPYEQGICSPTPWGDVFDVIVDDCPIEIMKEFPLMIALGDLPTDDTFLSKLRQYVEDGGILIISASQMSTAFDGLAGVNPERERSGNCGMLLWEDYGETRTHWDGKIHDENYYRYYNLRPTNAEILATNSFDHPVITSRTIGQGKIIVVAPVYGLMEGPPDKLLSSVKHLIGHLVNQVTGVKVDGEPVHWMLNNTDEGIILSLFNHTNKSWTGTIHLPSTGENIKNNALDIWDEATLSIPCDNGKFLVHLTLEPFGFKLLQFK